MHTCIETLRQTQIKVLLQLEPRMHLANLVKRGKAALLIQFDSTSPVILTQSTCCEKLSNVTFKSKTIK